MSLGWGQTSSSQQYGGDPFERRYAIIMQMPEGEAKNEAMRQLFMDYPGRISQAQDAASKGFEMATMQPAGMTEGNRANPFAVDVGAGLLQHIGNAGMAFKGGRDYKEAQDTLKDLSAKQEMATMGMAEAALQKSKADALRKKKRKGWMRF